MKGVGQRKKGIFPVDKGIEITTQAYEDTPFNEPGSGSPCALPGDIKGSLKGGKCKEGGIGAEQQGDIVF